MKLSRIALIAAFGAVLISSVALLLTYRQLEKAFLSVEEFVPTRIYSNVSRIFPGMSRQGVLARLNHLSYKWKPLPDNQVQFTLHEMTYPYYLIPDGHHNLKLGQAKITLTFEGPESQSPLEQIEADETEIPDLYLEPGIVATLSRGQDSRDDKIRGLIRFKDIPSPVWKAFIAIEDQHFLDHVGLDPKGLARAVWVNLKTLSFAQGGSTITQQLVKNLMVRRTKNVLKKISEIFLALILELRFSKEQILERYLNEVYLGQIGNYEIHGVVEGARYFFGKGLDEINLAEIALMAGLIRGPGYYSPYRYYDRAVARQKLVLQKMVETGQIAEEEMQSALEQPIRLAPPQTSTNKAPYFTDYVKAELIRLLKDRISEQEISGSGFKVYTTLDLYLNQLAQSAVTNGITRLEKNLKIADPKLLEGALASVDHRTGAIVALIGGKNYSQSTFNRILNMKRQVGSTFKPFVYLSAFKKGRSPRDVPYGPGYPMQDAKWKLIYDNGRQTWEPENYEKEYRGWITLREALTHSINTVAARLGTEVGYNLIIETAKQLGIHSELLPVPALSLGIAELSPVELLRAYSTLANRGVQDELTVIRGITLDDGTGYARFVYNPKSVFDTGLTDLMTEILQDVFQSGTARSAATLGFDRPAAGKTGTTSDHRDSWFAGYTPELTTVVWVGVDIGSTVDEKGKATVKLTGASSALPVWVDYMKPALEDHPPVPFPVSEFLTTLRIDRKTGQLAYSSCPEDHVTVEKYLVNQEPEERTCEDEWPISEPVTEL